MYLYHVAYLFNLPSIARHGLVPGFGQTFKGGWYEGYSKGWLFLTEGEGVPFWMSRLEEHAEANTDHPEEGWVPIVLSFEKNVDLVLEHDEVGSLDASADAWKTKQTVQGDLYVWTGADWEHIADVDAEALLKEVLAASEQEFDEAEDESWWLMDYEYFVPPDEELEERPYDS